MSGRPKAATKAEVLQVIHDTVTVSPSELAKSLNVNRATVYRRMKEISQQEIDQALGINENSQLTPAEKDFKVFCTIPKVKEFYDSLRYLKKRTGRYSARAFGSKPELRKAILQFPSVAFCTGTRAGKKRIGKDGKPVSDRGILSMRWENIKFESDVVIIRVVDKGRRGGITWYKKMIGEAAADFRQFYEDIGKPQTGRVFPFDYQTLLAFFKEVYKNAGIPKNLYAGMPLHIWRHTAAQEFLDVTDWNYGLCAKTLGWDGIQALEKHYGKMPDAAQLRGLRKAMGLPVEEVKKEFIF